MKAAGGKVAECLEKRVNELSAECKEKLTREGQDRRKPSAEKPAEAPREAAAPGSAETQAE